MTLNRIRLAALADYLAATVVISLPWSYVFGVGIAGGIMLRTERG